MAVGTTLGVASLALKGAGMLSGALGADKARKQVKKMRRLQYRLQDIEFDEAERQRGKRESGLLGMQATRYAAAGVRATVGSAKTVADEVRHEFSLEREFAKRTYDIERRLITEGGSLQRQQMTPNYLAQTASFASSVYDIGTSRGWFGT